MSEMFLLLLCMEKIGNIFFASSIKHVSFLIFKRFLINFTALWVHMAPSPHAKK